MGGLEKRGRIGRVKERKERGKGREVNKVSCSLPGQGTLASCPHQEETRDKRIPVAATGSDPLAGKLAPEYPEWSGCQSQGRRVSARVAICCRKTDPFQGLKLGSCLTFGNELSEETHVLIRQEIFLGIGHPGGEQEGKGTQENCSAAWLAVSSFMVMGLVSG